MKRKKVLYEPEDDVLNIWFSEKPVDHAEQTGDVIVHFTKDKEPVYVEILDASKLLKEFTDSMLAKKLSKGIFSESSVVAHRIK